MSMIPSLSVWSSVKFPFPKYFFDNKIPKRYSVESCDRFIKRNYEKTRAERAPEMVNLRVPCGLSVEKENSVPNLDCGCARRKQNCSKRKKRGNIRFVIVPEVIFYDAECSASNKSLPELENVSLETRDLDLTLREKDEESDVGGLEEKPDEIGSVPSIKPWTLEELVEINRQKEEAKKKAEARKSRGRHGALENHARALETLNRTLRSKENVTLPRDHYEDAELYHSKLGLNSGYTGKVHKIRWEED